ncbi:MAG: GFA family protein [Alphaproteobacteria bacterium]|nr:GFA family protein [Alphaproteobacteria bacterium]
MPKPTRLSCHCGAISLEVDAPVERLLQCNCSTCRRFGAIHWYVPADKVRMLEQSRPLSTYAWRHVHEGHHFCGTCGSSVMRTGYPDGVIALNACCIEQVDIFSLPVERFDGRTKMPPGITR